MEHKTNKKHTKTKKPYRWLRRFLRVLTWVVVFFVLLLLFIRSHWGQQLIVDKLVGYVADKTNTEIAIDKFFITFDGDLQMNGLYIEDKKGDTLIYSSSLEADIPLWKTITGETYGVENLHWDGLRANIIREDSINGYNFQFLIDAFGSSNTDAEESASETNEDINLVLGTFDFSDFKVKFYDEVIGINSDYRIGQLNAELENANLDSLSFDLERLVIQNSDFDIRQSQVESKEDDSNTSLPKIKIQQSTLQEVKTYFQNEDLATDIQIGDARLDNLFLGLDKLEFTTDLLAMDKAFISFNLKSAEEIESTPQNQDSSFEWPELILEANEVDMVNSKFEYTVNSEKPSRGNLNPNAITLNNLKIKANNFYLKDESARLLAQAISFDETSGLQLNTLKGDFKIDESAMQFKELEIGVNKNQVDGTILLSYTSLNQFITRPEEFQLDANISNYNLKLNEFYSFLPELESTPYFSELAQKPLSGTLIARGDTDILDIKTFQANWGNNTRLRTSAQLEKITSVNELHLDIPNLSFESSMDDVGVFYAPDESAIQLPETFQIEGEVSGRIDDMAADLKLDSSQGQINLKGNYTNQNQLQYDVALEVLEYELSKLLKNESLGDLTLQLEAKGQGSNLYNLDGNLKAEVQQFSFNDYTFKDLLIEGDLNNGNGDFSSRYKDKNLDFHLKSIVELDSTSLSTSTTLDLRGADLNGLGLLERDIKTGFQLAVDFNIKEDQYTAEVQLDEGVVVYNNENYLLGDLSSKVFASSDTTSVRVNNKMLDLDLRSNTNPQQLGASLHNHITGYFSMDKMPGDSITKPVKVKLVGTITESPVMKEIFLVNLKDLDTVQLAMDFDERKRNLDAKMIAPHINYYGNAMDSLKFSIHTTPKDFNFNLSFDGIQSGAFNIPETHFSGVQNEDKLSLLFRAIKDNSPLVHVKSSIIGDENKISYKIEPDSLILNSKLWTIAQNNEIVFAGDSISFKQFKIERNNQYVNLSDNLDSINKAHVALAFQNFNLKEVLSYFNPDFEIARGILEGDIVLTRPFSKSGILTELKIRDLNILNTDFGVLRIDGKSDLDDRYSIDASVKEGLADIDIRGQYTGKGENGDFDFEADINDFQMKALDSLSLGELQNSEGNLTGKINISGTTSNPIYDGQLNFKNAGFDIRMLNTKFRLPDEEVVFNNEAISFNELTVIDANYNTLTASGNIGTENYLNPTFDITLKAKDFIVLDAKKDDNDLFYGKAIIDADAKITGDLQIPKIEATLAISPETDFVYVLPTSTVSVEERDGVVTFVNRENPDAILTQTNKQNVKVTGFDINTRINVAEEAKFKVVIDENQDNEFQVQGNGELQVRMFPNGRLNLSGFYEAQDGYYKLSLYELVKRKFLVAPGSRVVWNGDPFNANLDVQAIYNVRASASSLMATQSSSLDPAERERYKQVLPFEVYLNIEGELFQPDISFRLDMEEDERDVAGGEIYGMVQQINQREEELNQQVFSLLVLNRFYPQPGSDGSSGGFSSLARQNVNDAIADRLNTFSNQVLGESSIELDFGLESYTDYQGTSPTERTQLNVAAQKKFFEDRLTVRVGSDIDLEGSDPNGETTSVVGNVSIIYELTPDGRFRLKGFRRNSFENVIDGQTIVDGIALIFTQEFNQFNQLWAALFKRKKMEESSYADDSTTKNEEKDK